MILFHKKNIISVCPGVCSESDVFMWTSDVQGEVSKKPIIQPQQVPGRLETGSANYTVHGVQVKASADGPLQMWRIRLRRSIPVLETMGSIFFIREEESERLVSPPGGEPSTQIGNRSV